MRIRIVILLCCVISLFSCRKKTWDEYYGRPDDLAHPIYQVLEERGNFTHFLKCIDKSGYKSSLGAGGYWTCFAPNDAAFEKYFKDKGISGDEGIDSATAQRIVKYALVYNAYRKDDLGSYQQSAGADTTGAFKRKTAYYKWVYKEGDSLVLSANRNGTYVEADNNNKYLPYFMDKYFSFHNLTASDYNFFYPNVEYSGFNVAGAVVVNSDIPAENGLIDEVDAVTDPLPNLEDYLRSNPQYSEFWRLLQMVASYTSNANITQRNYALSGKSDSVFIKFYDADNQYGLAFSPNNENYLLANTDGQSDGYGMVVPTNDALRPYEAEILKYYKTFEAAPIEVLLELLNAHMWTNSPWPSQLLTAANYSQEFPTFTLSNVVDKAVCSNGFFYGINTVQRANAFRTVYGKAFLDPDYTLMTRALNSDIKFSLINPDLRFTMAMISNKVLTDAGFSYSTERSAWAYQAPGGTISYGNLPTARLNRILAQSVFLTRNGEMDDLSGEGVVESWNGEYVRYKNNTLFASGNMDNGTVVHVTKKESTDNGTVLYTDGLLTYSEVALGGHLGRLAVSDPSHYSHFFNYLIHSQVWSNSDSTILGTNVGNPYTVFVPTNAAIEDAVKAGILPGDVTTGAPNFAPTDLIGQQNVTSFIQYSVLNKNMLATDGKKSGNYLTLLSRLDGTPTAINVQNSVTGMTLKGFNNDVAYLNLAQSNVLCDMATIHSITKVLDFRNIIVIP